MIIPLKIDRAAGGETQGGKSVQERKKGVCVPQWSMVELQGELISKDALSGQSLGSMTFENGKPVLVISHHKLEGKVASEPKPLLVLRKVIVPGCSSSSPDGGGSGSDAGMGGGSGDVVAGGVKRERVEYHVVGRVTRKTIFKTRPKPLIRKMEGGRSGSDRMAGSHF
eukprot:jgi/Undpi1/4139/HiC_scaffold_16.g07506.m1